MLLTPRAVDRIASVLEVGGQTRRFETSATLLLVDRGLARHPASRTEWTVIRSGAAMRTISMQPLNPRSDHACCRPENTRDAGPVHSGRSGKYSAVSVGGGPAPVRVRILALSAVALALQLLLLVVSAIATFRYWGLRFNGYSHRAAHWRLLKSAWATTGKFGGKRNEGS